VITTTGWLEKDQAGHGNRMDDDWWMLNRDRFGTIGFRVREPIRIINLWISVWMERPV
jgi:hypothetical protein